MFDRWKSDIDLLKASRDGSTQAFGIVVSRYQALVCAITYGATGDSGRSEELAQDAFLRAWKGLGQLQDLSKFRAWLCSIARNTVQNWFRSQGRDVAGRAASLDAAAETTSRESGPEEVVMFEEQQTLIRQALAQMPEGVREPLILFYREGKSTREVAVQLGLTEEAARQRIYRGRNLLREQMASMVENAIVRTKPGKAFTAAVIASIVGLGFKGSATAVAAAGSYGAASVLSGLTAKVVAVAVGAVVIAGGIVAYKQITNDKEPAGPSAAVQTVEQQQSGSTSPIAGTSPVAGVAGGPTDTPVAASSTGTRTGVDASSVGRDRRFGVAEGKAGAFEFQARGVLSGRVTDIETGEPVGGARLTVSLRSVYAAITDANGFYFLEKINEAGDYSISVTCEEYLRASQGEGGLTVNLSPDTQIVRHLQLRKACMIDVWVVDANGVGIPDARVVGTLLADDRMREVNRSIYSRKTDPNGYILLGGFPPADTDYLITAWHTVAAGVEERDGRRYTLSECDYAPARAAVRLTDPNVIRQIRIVLERGAPVQARVEYADGIPAANVEIAVTPAWWHCTHGLPGLKTGDDGVLTLEHVVEGLYDVSVRTPTSESGFMTQKVMQARLPAAGNEPLVVRLADKSPQSLVSIRGSLVFRGEKLPDSVRITMMSPSGAYIFLDVQRKPDGRLEDTFAIERLEPGTYSLTFSGENIEETTLDNVAAPSSDLRVELAYVPKLELAGNVVDGGTGQPVRHFRIRVKKLRSLRGPLYVQPNRWVDFENERGDFSADLVGPGVYQVQVAAEGYAPAWSEPISTDASRNVLVSLSAGGAISGRVVNEKGEPLSGATVIPLSLAGGNMSEVEDVFIGPDGAVETVGGVFTLPHVPAGAETVKVAHPGYASRIVEGIPVIAGQTRENVNVVLSAGGTIEGTVYDLQGRPQAGQVLYVQDAAGYLGVGDEEAGRRGQAVTDANGFYRIENLPPELCYVQRSNKWQGLGVVCRMAVPRDGRVARVDLGGVPVVRGRLVIDRVPLAGVRLLIGPVRSPHSGAFTCYATTDEQGGFTFGGAMPGVYSIYRQQSADRNQWLAVGTVTVADADMDVGVLPPNASNLYVTLNSTDAVEKGGIDSVFLTKGRRLWSTPTGIAEAPSTAGAPYVIKGVEPGSYVLNVRRRDQVLWQKQVELDAGRSRWEVSVDLPAWKASVSARIGGGGSRTLVLWREQKDVFALVQSGPDGACRAQHLPAGRYFIGEASCALYDVPPMAELQLQDGQETALDLDLSAATAGQTGFLLVQAVDEQGWVCDGAQIRLEGPLGVVEPVYTDEIGRGFLTVPGSHTLSVQAAGYRGVARKVNVKPFDPYVGRAQNLVICLDRN
jgi:RNA polymerase sigma factor (sigma-70 family)